MTRAKDISKIVTDADLSGTLDVTGETTLATHLNMGDNDKIKLGASGDLEIYHDGSNSYIDDTGTGNLLIRAENLVLEDLAGNNYFTGAHDGAAKIYHINNLKLETTTSGVTVTGLVKTSNTYQVWLGADVLGSTGGLTSIGANPIVIGTDGTERMRITSTGNVGIGNSNPEDFGSLVDNLVIGTTSGENGMTIVSGTGNGGRIQFADNTSSPFRGAFEYDHSSDDMIFYTAGSQRMRIKDYGSILIGTTNASPAEGTANGVRLGSNGTSQFSSSGDAGLSSNRTSDNGNAITLRRDGTIVGSISVTGSATAYNTSSDYRLKENVVEMTNATTRLKQLQPKRFNFIADADTTVDGFLAHQVSSIVPEAVFGTHNEVDADGNAVMQGIDQSKLVPLLVKTIQELEARITTLENGE